MAYIGYAKTTDLEGSNLLNNIFSGSGSEVNDEWTQLTTTTPGIMTDGTLVRLAQKFNDAGIAVDMFGETETMPDAGLYTYDPGSRAINALTVTGAVDGETVTIGADVYEFDTQGGAGSVTEGNIRVNVSGGNTAAGEQVLTITDEISADETVVIGEQTYTFVEALADPNDVLVGADDEASLANLASAINGGAGEGTTYATGTEAHELVTAVSDETTLTVTAIIPGSDGNAIEVSDTMANGSWGDTELAGGDDPTGEEVVDALVEAINSGSGVEKFTAQKHSDDTVLIYGQTAQPLTVACDTDMNDGAWLSETTFGGTLPKARRMSVQKRVPTSAEVTKGVMYFKFDFDVKAVLKSFITTSSGVAVAWGGALTVSGSLVALTNDTNPDFATTTTVTLIAFG